MKIGDEVYIHGYVDEIRNDVVIIRNKGGYFGTVPSEIKLKTESSDSEKPNDCEDEPQEWWLTENSLDDFKSGFIHGYAQAKHEYESKTEPQTEYPCNTCANKGDHDGECSNCIASSEPIRWKTPSHYKPKDESQTECETCKHCKFTCELFSEICKYEPKDALQHDYESAEPFEWGKYMGDIKTEPQMERSSE